MEKSTIRGILCVGGGLVMHLYLGCFYLWGNIQVYIASYFNKVDGPVTLDDTSIIFVIQTIAQALFMPVAPFLMMYLPPWGLCIIGACFAIGGVFISSFVKSFTLFAMIYPVLFGIGIGFSYMAPIVSGWEYFPNKRGLVSGLIVLGFGFGSFIFGFISLAVANPDNEKASVEVSGGKIFPPDSHISSNAPKMIRINCAVWLGLLLLAVFFIQRKRVHKEPKVRFSSLVGDNPISCPSEDYDSDDSDEKAQDNSATVEPTFKESLKDYRTWQLWIMIVLSSSYPYYIASNFKSYESQDVDDDRFITIVGAVGAVFNGLSRGFWSALQDRVGFKIVYISLLIVEIGVGFTVILIHKVKVLYLIWVCLSFTCLGGHFSIYPTLCARIYGPSMGGKMYAVLFTAFSTATLFNWVLSKASSKVIYILASMAVLALVSAIFLNDKSKVKKKYDKLLDDTS